MKQEKLRIQTREVREGLRRLLGELDNADLSGLGGRVRSTKTAAAWLEALRTAERELGEWCPNLEAGPNQFTIDVPPKAR